MWEAGPAIDPYMSCDAAAVYKAVYNYILHNIDSYTHFANLTAYSGLLGSEGKLDSPILELIRQNISMARILYLVHLDDGRLWPSTYSPYTLVVIVFVSPVSAVS